MPTTTSARFHTCSRARRQANERALTIVEVAVAVMVLMIVATAVGMASFGSSRSRGAARLQSSLTAAGQHAQEDVIADRAWMREVGDCSTINHDCDISAYVTDEALELEDVEARATLESATATALDSVVDKIGDDDEDGVIPDYYRITVVLQLRAEDAPRYQVKAADTVRRFVTTIDRRGEEQLGSVAVEICRIANQADERMQIQGCAESGDSHVSMLNCEPTEATCDASQPKVHGDCSPGVAAPCTTAFSWINHLPPSTSSPLGPSPFVTLRRVAPGSVSFALVNASTLEKVPSSAAKQVNGTYVFQNVPAGEFRLDGLPTSVGGNTERWRSKELPGFHGSAESPAERSTIAVDPGIQSRALVMYRPKATTDGIDLHFQRKTRTYELRGPFTAEEVSVGPEPAPTHGYEGASAASYCSLMQGSATDESQHSTFDCVGIQPGPGQNCVQLLIEGSYYVEVGAGNGDYYYLYPDIVYSPGTGDGHLMKHSTNGPTPAYRFCTFYKEYLTHTYYGNVDKNPPWDMRAGAAKANTYWVEPVPDLRHVDYGDDGPYAAIPQCIVKWKGQCEAPNTPATPDLGDGLKPGLNTQLNAEKAGAAATNAWFSGTPAWLEDPMWVYPSGSFRSRSGSTQPAGVDWTFTGMGECYWKSPKFSGEHIGECNPCTPLWMPGQEVPGACSILVNTHWERPAWETVTELDWRGTGTVSSPLTKPIEGKSGDISYSPYWRCSTPTPKVTNGSTCRSAPSGGSGDTPGVPATKHRTSVPNTSAVVKANPFTQAGVT